MQKFSSQTGVCKCAWQEQAPLGTSFAYVLGSSALSTSLFSPMIEVLTNSSSSRKPSLAASVYSSHFLQSLPQHAVSQHSESYPFQIIILAHVTEHWFFYRDNFSMTGRCKFLECHISYFLSLAGNRLSLGEKKTD